MLKNRFKVRIEVYLLFNTICYFRRFVTTVCNRFKSLASIQKCIHFNYCRRKKFEIKRQGSSMANWGLK